MVRMGLDFGLDKGQYCKRRNRWLFRINGVVAPVLPPLRSARPNLGFKEMEIRHLNEDVYYPMKPDWKTINLILYDIQTTNANPVFQWLSFAYNPRNDARWTPVGGSGFFKQANLEMYDGCGNLIEIWIFEEVWPSQINFQELDMASSEILTIDLTLRYARAYIN